MHRYLRRIVESFQKRFKAAIAGDTIDRAGTNVQPTNAFVFVKSLFGFFTGVFPDHPGCELAVAIAGFNCPAFNVRLRKISDDCRGVSVFVGRHFRGHRFGDVVPLAKASLDFTR